MWMHMSTYSPCHILTVTCDPELALTRAKFFQNQSACFPVSMVGFLTSRLEWGFSSQICARAAEVQCWSWTFSQGPLNNYLWGKAPLLYASFDVLAHICGPGPVWAIRVALVFQQFRSKLRLAVHPGLLIQLASRLNLIAPFLGRMSKPLFLQTSRQRNSTMTSLVAITPLCQIWIAISPDSPANASARAGCSLVSRTVYQPPHKIRMAFVHASGRFSKWSTIQRNTKYRNWGDSMYCIVFVLYAGYLYAYIYIYIHIYILWKCINMYCMVLCSIALYSYYMALRCFVSYGIECVCGCASEKYYVNAECGFGVF